MEDAALGKKGVVIVDGSCVLLTISSANQQCSVMVTLINEEAGFRHTFPMSMLDSFNENVKV